jgi:uncharacterized protein YndB with AHSA1/START domain
MRILQQSIISRPSAAVWPYIVIPEQFAKWNDKVASIEARERFRAGQQFTTHYLWKGTELQCLSVVAKLEEGRLLEIRHTRCIGPASHPDMKVTERVELEDQGDRSIVTKTVIVSNSAIPFLLRPLVWFISRFGKPTGEDKLKMLCEGGD